MNIIKAYPPNIEAIREVFPIRKNTIFTYGDTIYAPEIDFKLPPDLVRHEETHMMQQGDDPAGWWEKYLSDKAFRKNQEAEAYRNQYRFYCRFVKGRNERFRFLRILGSDFASPLYGSIVGFLEATQLIKS